MYKHVDPDHRCVYCNNVLESLLDVGEGGLINVIYRKCLKCNYSLCSWEIEDPKYIDKIRIGSWHIRRKKLVLCKGYTPFSINERTGLLLCVNYSECKKEKKHKYILSFLDSHTGGEFCLPWDEMVLSCDCVETVYYFLKYFNFSKKSFLLSHKDFKNIKSIYADKCLI